MKEYFWDRDLGVYFGFAVEPKKPRDDRCILEEEWEVERLEHNLYPNPYRKNVVGDRHLITIGPNGSGKTRRLLVPNLFRLKSWSTVVIDIKGELTALTGAFRAAQEGHKVLVIDPFRVMEKNYPRLVEKYPGFKSHGLNPVQALDPESDEFPDDAMRLAEALISVEGNEPHWSQSAQDLVAAIIMYVRLDRPEKASLADVRRILGLPLNDFADEIIRMMATGDVCNCEALRIKAARYSVITNESRELNGIISTALTQTRWLDSLSIKTDLASGSFDFSVLKRSPTTVYLILPPRYLATHGTWLRVMITSILLPLLRSVDDSDFPVLFMLDEFAQLGHVAVIENNMALLRGFGVKLWAVFQDLAQAKAIYKERWESFIGNAGVVQSFAPQDKTTRDYLSDISGQRFYWFTSSGTSSSQSAGQQSSQSAGLNETLQHMPGPVLWPQALAQMELGEAVLFARGRVVRTFLPDPEDDSDLIKLRKEIQKAKLLI